MRIIYIDDDSDDREFFCDAMAMVDPRASCTTFDNAEEGVNFLAKNDLKVDYLFIDINMPRMNGYESVREIRSLSKLQKVPIIMLTTSFSPADLLEFKELGIQILKKPSRMADLVQSLKALLLESGQLEEKS